MNKQFKLGALAVAIGAAMAAPAAYASGGEHGTTSSAVANLSSDQASMGIGSVSMDASNQAKANHKVLQNASGNIGLNVAAGSENMQANNATLGIAAGSLLTRTSAEASVGNAQVGNIDSFSMSLSPWWWYGGSNSATVSNQVMQNASGNIGLNVAAGDQNMQANNTGIAVGVGSQAFGEAESSIGNLQDSGLFFFWGDGDAAQQYGSNQASLSDQVLQHASGNIGVNVAAGAENMGANNMALALDTNGLYATAGIDSQQISGMLQAWSQYALNTAYLNDQVLQYAGGNIGVNAAAGLQNLQGNNLAVSTAGAGYPSSPVATKSSSSASVYNGQMANVLNASENTGGNNSASVSNQVLQHASGNIGVNVAAGTQNMQANNSAIAVSWGTKSNGVAAGSAENRQSSGPFAFGGSRYSYNQAGLGDQVLQDASGNIGVNDAAGAQNLQGNSLSVAYNNAGKRAISMIGNDQASVAQFAANQGYGWWFGGQNTASLSGEVMQHASGNIGVNVAAGTQNMQSNATVVSNAAGTTGSTTSSLASIWDAQSGNNGMTLCRWMYAPSVALLSQTSNNAFINGNVLQDATGNIGANVASGVQNMQGNNTAIATAWGTKLGGDAAAMVFGSQTAGGLAGTLSVGTHNDASVSQYALQNASGHIGVNVAAGAQNIQGNDLAYAYNRGGRNGVAVTQVSQVSLGQLSATLPKGDGDYDGDGMIPVNTASVTGHVLQNASGDIGLNVAAGAGNLQRNTLTISDAD
ncbi:beta strand repeat-containing protein [Acidihalobacter prosperus]|uniref:Uncharacterized protein n=1 Tax=Acidihalobacter prosperus TaxID=160660 RepID=A0A1A6C0N8_9GAMM|nr:hypothetical protein [Acidihalobacter prosperus]OBS08114.1 hypothetical protein Thpro_022364 [Acidihalobacter prosperus]